MFFDRFSGLRPLERLSATGFEWRTPTKRLAVLAALTNGATGIWFAIFQVQGWKMPNALAIILLIPVGLTIVGALAVAMADVSRNARALIEHRATNVPWVVTEPPGLLDYEPDAVRAQERLTSEFEKVAKDTRIVGKKLTKANKQVPRLPYLDIYARQRWANRTARGNNTSAIFMENRQAMLKKLVWEIERNQDGVVANWPLETPEQIQGARDFRDTLDGNRTATHTTIGSLEGYRESVEGFEAQNLSRSLRTASGRLGNALGGVITVLRKYEKVCSKLVSDLDRRLAQIERGET